MNERRAGSALVSLLAVAALAACGGGGGGDSGGDTEQAYAINSANAELVARVGLSALQTGQLAGTADDGLVGPTALQAGVNQAMRAHALAQQVLQSGRRFALAGQTVPCLVSGTMTFSFTDKNANGLLDQAGESIGIVASNCINDAEAAKLNGGFQLTLASYTNLTHYSYDLSFANFAATDPANGYVLSINGPLSVTRNGLANAAVHSDAFTVKASKDGFLHEFSASAVDVSVQATVDQLSETLAGTFTGGEFSGRSLVASTPSPMVTLAADTYPSQGTLLLVGAKKSALKVEAIDATNARVSVDADGDGAFETVKVMLWVDLL